MGFTANGAAWWGKKMNEVDFSIRTFVFPQDLEAVLELWRNAGEGIHLGQSDTYDEIAKKLARDPQLTLVAEKEGCIVGAVMGGFDGRRGLVYHLATHPSQRKQGIAGALMDELEKRLGRSVVGVFTYWSPPKTQLLSVSTRSAVGNAWRS